MTCACMQDADRVPAVYWMTLPSVNIWRIDMVGSACLDCLRRALQVCLCDVCKRCRVTFCKMHGWHAVSGSVGCSQARLVQLCADARVPP